MPRTVEQIVTAQYSSLTAQLITQVAQLTVQVETLHEAGQKKDAEIVALKKAAAATTATPPVEPPA